MAKLFQRILYSLGFERGEELLEQDGYQFDMELGEQQIKVASPKAFEEARRLAAHIKEGRPVIINLENLPHAVSQRIVDYMSGATYILNGDMQKIGQFIFLFTPQGIDIGIEELLTQEQKSDTFPFRL
ncbi:MAG: cell division protein SepF [Firmicutes bacterium]|nr:cell division protein SepF [Bacillota bacterium]